MLEALVLKYLTKKGVIAYFVGQVIFIAILAYYIFGILDYSLDRGRDMFFIGMVVIVLLWMGVCLLLWRKPKEKIDENSKNNI
ncbi:hypothetical protein [Tenacibaculum sp. Bg11-29]|uniref:hypothetical protein n=1 Tax=Tenacibaculum sp. Bg11-29 TaxID=2058306 RepID=UPI0012FE914E|nr:hypothetical protein [Tenacibaculum sp. Bg11-29]